MRNQDDKILEGLETYMNDKQLSGATKQIRT